MSHDRQEQQEQNRRALVNPQPGDYWHEMFCPYFVVVDRRDDDITVLGCLGSPNSHNRKDQPNAKIDHPDGTWSFDYSQSMTVDRAWIERAVRYESIDGFVADVVNSERTRAIVSEWRDHYQLGLLEQIEQIKTQWEQFTGWKYLKEIT